MKYVEDLKCESNAEIGPEDIFDIVGGKARGGRLYPEYRGDR
jgi:hypothetical protein